MISLSVALSCTSLFATPKTLIVANHCSRAISIAFSSYVMSIGRYYWAAEGYYTVPPGQSSRHNISSGNRFAYAWAQADNGAVLTGNDAAFCLVPAVPSFSRQFVSPSGFTLWAGRTARYGAGCAEVGGQMLGGFQKLDFGTSYTQFTLNVNCN